MSKHNFSEEATNERVWNAMHALLEIVEHGEGTLLIESMCDEHPEACDYVERTFSTKYVFLEAAVRMLLERNVLHIYDSSGRSLYPGFIAVTRAGFDRVKRVLEDGANLGS